MSFSPENATLAAKQVSAATLKLRFLKKLKCTLKYEKSAWAGGAKLIAGVDEVGRGSLFGPVVAAAVILEPGYRIRGLRDSKLIPEKKRDELAKKIREHSLGISIAAVDSGRIDQINIYHASREAMLLAVQQLLPQPDHLLIDAMTVEHDCAQTKIIHGDALSASIAAASIIAKVERDRMIRELDSSYPGYDLASNKGYSAPKHIAALRERGPSALHRQSFAPVWLSTKPQEVLAFMEEEAALDEVVAEVADA
jgi:ribonuclease HII